VAEALRGLRNDWAERRTERRAEIEHLLSSPTLDRTRAMDLLEEAHQTMADRRHEIVDAFADFSDSLGTDQRTRLAELVRERMGHRWGPPGCAH
jgi:uncharacterized membrane protein